LLVANSVAKENVMQTIARVGVDLAKIPIQLHAVDSEGNVVVRKAVQRRNFLACFPD
jgi:hypothetical protein